MTPFQGRNASQGDTLLSVSATLPKRLSDADLQITLVPMTETAVANNIILEQEPVAIVNGQVNTQIRVPSDPEFDVGAVQIYAWDAGEEAIGHATYDILSRYVKNVRLVPFPVASNQPTHLYVEVVDKNAIDEITLFWYDWIEGDNKFFSIPVVPHTGTTYRSERPIPGYPDAQPIDYYLEVKVKTGRTFQTETVAYDVGDVEIEIDLALLAQTFTWDTTPPFTLSAQIRNIEEQTVRNIPVQFFVKALKGETNTASINTATTSILEQLKGCDTNRKPANNSRNSPR